MPTEAAGRPKPPSRWDFAPDGRTAQRRDATDVVLLTGEAPSSKVYPRYWQRAMPSLQFSVTAGRYRCDFEVERATVILTEDRREGGPYFHFIWKVDYPTMRVGVDSAGPVLVSQLGHRDWLELDMLLLGVLADWPTREDEIQWLDEYKRNDRMIFVVGCRLGRGWDGDFVRTLNRDWSLPSSAVRYTRRRYAPRSPRTGGSEGWPPILGAPGVINPSTGATLTYRRRIPILDGKRSYAVFEFEDVGRQLPIAVLVPELEFDPPVWRVSLTHSLLMAGGWSLERIRGARSDEEWQVLDQALYDTTIRDPIAFASLMNELLDALLHWQRVEGADIAPADAITMTAGTNDYAYKPFEHVGASTSRAHYWLFDTQWVP